MIKRWKTLATLGFATVVAAAAYLGLLQMTGNFHAVIAGELYRSAQPTADDINRFAKSYGIKTVINLRGQASEAWYRHEVSASQAAGIKHIDFPMSASRQLSLQEVDRLVSIMRQAPKPILIHCKAGADRTGLASLLYLAEIVRASPEEAERQLTFRFGHLSIPYLSAAYPMDQTWELVEEKSYSNSKS